MGNKTLPWHSIWNVSKPNTYIRFHVMFKKGIRIHSWFILFVRNGRKKSHIFNLSLFVSLKLVFSMFTKIHSLYQAITLKHYWNISYLKLIPILVTYRLLSCIQHLDFKGSIPAFIWCAVFRTQIFGNDKMVDNLKCLLNLIYVYIWMADMIYNWLIKHN